MPQMDGLSFLKTLRGKAYRCLRYRRWSRARRPSRCASPLARAAGANFYVVKPLSQETLVQYALLLCGVRHE